MAEPGGQQSRAKVSRGGCGQRLSCLQLKPGDPRPGARTAPAHSLAPPASLDASSPHRWLICWWVTAAATPVAVTSWQGRCLTFVAVVPLSTVLRGCSSSGAGQVLSRGSSAYQRSISQHPITPGRRVAVCVCGGVRASVLILPLPGDPHTGMLGTRGKAKHPPQRSLAATTAARHFDDTREHAHRSWPHRGSTAGHTAPDLHTCPYIWGGHD